MTPGFITTRDRKWSRSKRGRPHKVYICIFDQYQEPSRYSHVCLSVCVSFFWTPIFQRV